MFKVKSIEIHAVQADRLCVFPFKTRSVAQKFGFNPCSPSIFVYAGGFVIRKMSMNSLGTANKQTIKEGLAKILVPENYGSLSDPKKVSAGDIPSQSVFYNPIQQFNRDLSVLAIRAFAEDRSFLCQTRRQTRSSRKAHRTPKNRVHSRDSVRASFDSAAEISGQSQEKAKYHTSISPPQSPPNGDQNAQPSPKRLKFTPSAEDSYGLEDLHTAQATAKQGSQSHPNRSSTPIRILDALTATGLRALRYGLEIPFETLIVANDLSKDAIALVKANIAYNELKDNVRPMVGDAIAHMHACANGERKNLDDPCSRYDVIDLDPYGTAVPFLDAALRALNDGGLLCVTCTDAGVWASAGYPEKTFALYGGLPIRGVHSHEGGLRLILNSIATSAARQGIAIEPLLSLSIDFYARVFVRIKRSPADVKFLASKTMILYSCDQGCGAWETQFLARNVFFENKKNESVVKYGMSQAPTTGPFCNHCGFKTHISGPMFGGPLHNQSFIKQILSYLRTVDTSTYHTASRIEGMLQTALEECLDTSSGLELSRPAQVDLAIGRPIPESSPSERETFPFFFIPSALAKVMHCRAPSESAVKGALRHAGFRATRSHIKPGSIRTNAPWTFIWKIMREWVRQKAPIKNGALREGTAGWRIVKDDSEMQVKIRAPHLHQVDVGTGQKRSDEGGSSTIAITGMAEAPVIFDEALGKDLKTNIVRYQPNPQPFWGPLNKARK